MMSYSYQVGDRTGKVYDGKIEAQDEREAVDKLKKQGYFILRLRRADREDLSVSDLIDKAERILGYHPRYGVADSLRDMLAAAETTAATSGGRP